MRCLVGSFRNGGLPSVSKSERNVDPFLLSHSYQYGASVILEGRDGANQRCTGTITAIGAQDVAIRRSSDHGICRVTVQQLKQGRYTLWPAKIT